MQPREVQYMYTVHCTVVYESFSFFLQFFVLKKLFSTMFFVQWKTSMVNGFEIRDDFFVASERDLTGSKM